VAAGDALFLVLRVLWQTPFRDLPNRWAFPGQRLLNASTGPSLAFLALGVLGSCCLGTSPVIEGLSRMTPLETTNRYTTRPLRQVLLCGF